MNNRKRPNEGFDDEQPTEVVDGFDGLPDTVMARRGLRARALVEIVLRRNESPQQNALTLLGPTYLTLLGPEQGSSDLTYPKALQVMTPEVFTERDGKASVFPYDTLVELAQNRTIAAHNTNCNLPTEHGVNGAILTADGKIVLCYRRDDKMTVYLNWSDDPEDPWD